MCLFSSLGDGFWQEASLPFKMCLVCLDIGGGQTANWNGRS
jgi:hypothetical protein